MELLEIQKMSTYAWTFTAIESMYKFCIKVMGKFGQDYFRGPNEEETTHIMTKNERVFSEMLESIDCMQLVMEELLICLTRYI
jgi:hypothetical protein